MDRQDRLYFGGLQQDITTESFQTWLAGIIGPDLTLIRSISVINSRGAAFVAFNRAETMELVLQHDAVVWNGNHVRIRRVQAVTSATVAPVSNATPEPANSNKAIASAFCP